MNRSKELYRVSAAWASSMVAYSANPYLQLSFVFRSRTNSTRRKVFSLAPKLESPVVDATLPFFADCWADCEADPEGLLSLAAPFAKSSSVTESSRPRKRRNCEGTLSGAASLSPILAGLVGMAGSGFRLWHRKHLTRVEKLLILH